jgi:hemoglobin
VPDGTADELMGYFVPAAEHLRNDTGLPIGRAR